MIYKLLRKLGLGHIAYTLVAPVYSAKYKKSISDLDVGKAWALLHGVSEDKGSSCVLSEKVTDKESDIDLDIIIPAYNVETYIRQCIDSVLAQDTGYSYRIIAVDDGSTDSTGKILDSYDGLTVIHQENRGLSGARNSGLEISTAKYVLFLDSDDCINPDTVEMLLAAAVQYDADIAEGGYTEVDDMGKTVRCHIHKAGIINSGYGYAWGKIYRRELFNNIKFPEGYFYEDSLLSAVIYPKLRTESRKMVGIADSVFMYRQNSGGITRKSQGKPKSLDSLYITIKLFADSQILGLDVDGEYYDYILSMAVQTYSRTRLLGDEVQQAVFIVYADFVEKNFVGFKTQNKKLACLEKALKNRDYGSYLAYCKLH